MSRSSKVLSKASRAIESFLPAQVPPSLDKRAATLPQVLSRYPHDGVGLKVHQCRWGHKGIDNSYYLVTRSKLKLEGKHGKAWGKLFWKGTPSCNALPTLRTGSLTPAVEITGKAVSDTDELISGSLKYNWRAGPSNVVAPPKVAAPAPPQQIES